MKLKVLSLCSGIGGFEIGAKLANQRLGQEVFQLKALCEKNKFCRDRALKPNFPGIPIYEDIRAVPAIAGDYDLIVGGLPCQPFSVAGKKKGADDDRNLFPEFFRILRSVRPRGAVIENVPGLLAADSGRFFRDVLWQFTEAGYSVAWHVISCAEVGGVHLRERLWIIAYTDSGGRNNRTDHREGRRFPSDSNREDKENQSTRNRRLDRTGKAGAIDANSDCEGWQQRERRAKSSRREKLNRSAFSNSNGKRRKKETQPGICCGNDGVSSELVQSHLMTPDDLPDQLPNAADSNDILYRKEMLEAYGNAIVPDVAAIALYRLLEVSGLINLLRG